MGKNTKISTADLEEIFVDRRDVKFWKKEGLKHSYLFWVRAMLSRDPVSVERPRISTASIGVDVSVKERKDIYELLAKCFDVPTLELIKNLTDGSFSDMLRCLNVPEGKKLILDTGDLDNEEALDVLKKEYTGLFFDTYLPFIPPYESIYRGEKHVMSKYTRDVDSFYRKIGLGVESDMPDHISHECEFVSILCEKELNALKETEKEGYRVMRNEFLRNHLLGWGSMFCSDLCVLAKSDFYKGISLIGKEFFDLEYNLVCSR
ncbi:MAG: hypothetical protein A7316_07100 [Candidatus Altiarchaeales archaeon WOR_SM1_86-2]|nr:MAG: hypothetical protein A7315_05510 [Candidatus Altiarchaeales archaeon WOR_SM1_79]ODS38803.1 MAG: hypothetical protein A7316_07100 [Candidatus Altiarchaeales archaeon WOR_SM1_86-2]